MLAVHAGLAGQAVDLDAKASGSSYAGMGQSPRRSMDTKRAQYRHYMPFAHLLPAAPHTPCLPLAAARSRLLLPHIAPLRCHGPHPKGLEGRPALDQAAITQQGWLGGRGHDMTRIEWQGWRPPHTDSPHAPQLPNWGLRRSATAKPCARQAGRLQRHDGCRTRPSQLFPWADSVMGCRAPARRPNVTYAWAGRWPGGGGCGGGGWRAGVGASSSCHEGGNPESWPPRSD